MKRLIYFISRKQIIIVFSFVLTCVQVLMLVSRVKNAEEPEVEVLRETQIKHLARSIVDIKEAISKLESKKKSTGKLKKLLNKKTNELNQIKQGVL